jgi:hypothetical protein
VVECFGNMRESGKSPGFMSYERNGNLMDRMKKIMELDVTKILNKM